jgi:hypothetical protein
MDCVRGKVEPRSFPEEFRRGLLARRLRQPTAMAKSRKRNAGVSAVASDAGNPQYARATVVGAPDPERIAERAYQKYIERGGSDGRDLEDWLEAERELARTG